MPIIQTLTLKDDCGCCGNCPATALQLSVVFSDVTACPDYENLEIPINQLFILYKEGGTRWRGKATLGGGAGVGAVDILLQCIDNQWFHLEVSFGGYDTFIYFSGLAAAHPNGATISNQNNCSSLYAPVKNIAFGGSATVSI